MTTRRRDADAPLAQGRYMSAPEYGELHGLSGSAVAAKVAVQTDARARSLLLFLLAMSLRDGGLKANVVDKLMAMFPERIGTPSMHKFGMKVGQVYNAAQVQTVREEVACVPSGLPSDARVMAEMDPAEQPYLGRYRLKGEYEPAPSYLNPGDRQIENALREQKAQQLPASYPASAFVDQCRDDLATSLEGFLVEVCINPRIHLFGAGGRHDASHPLFRDIEGALLEFQTRHAKAARESFIQTTASVAAFRTLERGRTSRKIVVVNGVEGIGKSFGARAWCEQYLGEFIFVQLEGIVSQTTFFQAISKACGLACSVHQKAVEMQTRVRAFLERSGAGLVIDEAHRLFPATERISRHPELINWIYTLWDRRIPCALICTPQFLSRLDEVEKQTDWRSGQFKRRVECWTTLPEQLTEGDLRAVAPSIIEAIATERGRSYAYSANMLEELVDFGLKASRQLDSMARAVSAADFIATEQGRTAPTGRDLIEGIAEANQTERSLVTEVDLERQKKGGKRKPGRGPATPLQDRCESPAADTFTGPERTLRSESPQRGVTVPA